MNTIILIQVTNIIYMVYKSNRNNSAKFRLKLKKVGKITRQFRYDLNEIPYDYTGEVINRFKGLDLVDSVGRTIHGGS